LQYRFASCLLEEYSLNVPLALRKVKDESAIPHKPLTVAGRYVNRDVAAKKPIAWGTASGTFDRGAGVTMENLRNAACDFSTNLIKKSQFDPAYNQTKTNRK
jgi:hypothetical protein